MNQILNEKCIIYLFFKNDKFYPKNDARRSEYENWHKLATFDDASLSLLIHKKLS